MMRGKNILTKRFFYSYNELDSVAEFLEKKASEGWELTSKTGVIFGFRKCKPKKVKISVELVETVEGDGQREMFNEMCKAAGWENIFSDGKLQIYQTEDIDALPIHTEPEIKLNLVHKKCRFEQRTLLVIAVILIYFTVKQLINGSIYDIFSSGSLIGTYILFPLLILVALLNIVNYQQWYRKAKKSIEVGESPQYKSSKINKLCNWISGGIATGILWFGLILDDYYIEGIKGAFISGVFLGAVLLFIFLFSLISARFSKSRKGAWPEYIFGGIVVVLLLSMLMIIFSNEDRGEAVQLSDGSYTTVYNEDIPLTMEELGITTREYEYRVSDRIGSPLAQRVSFDDFSDNAENSSLYYNIYTVKTQKLYDKVTKKLIEDFASIEAKAASFGANEAYYSKNDEGYEWLLLYDEGIVKLSADFELAESQKEIAGRELKSYLIQIQ